MRQPLSRMWRSSSYRIHSMAGLVAGLWLLVMGGTGLLLDHRDWRWMWQRTVPQWLVPERIAERAGPGASVRIYRINPVDPDSRLAAGPQGMWWSENSGRSWTKTVFKGGHGTPWIYAVVEGSATGGGPLWLATDDGVWLSRDNGRTAARAALQGIKVNALAGTWPPGELIGVAENPMVFRLRPRGEARVEWLVPPRTAAADDGIGISLLRLVHDLHFGRGLLSGRASLIINDAGGVALVLLPATGLLFHFLPRLWRRGESPAGTRLRRMIMRMLVRLHATFLGLTCLVAVTYLSVTGILINHPEGLDQWMESVSVHVAYLPPAYRGNGLSGRIYAVAGYPNEPEMLSIGTRNGLYTTVDGGSTWRREDLPGHAGPVWNLRRIGDDLFASPNLVRSGKLAWRTVGGPDGYYSDITRTADGRMVWKTYRGIVVEKLHGMARDEAAHPLPHSPGVPWFHVIEGLHTGALIHPGWKWVNDAAAATALVLCVTGVARWFKRTVRSRER